MIPAAQPWRLFCVLGRVSNLPTVWSNLLAAWLLCGGGAKLAFAWTLLGATLLYLGGMFLNDAMDAEFDRMHRRERPVPRGLVSERTVQRLGSGLLAGGVVACFLAGLASGVMGLCLAASVLLYDSVHKGFIFAPLLMGLCRWQLYLLAGSTAELGLSGLAIWSGLALGLYVAGLSYLAHNEAWRTPAPRWPVLLLAAPVGLALLVNTGRHREAAVLLSVILALWCLRVLRAAYIEPTQTGRAVAGLLAGIVLVDWLAVADQARTHGLWFIALFLLALVLQRFVPAT